MGTSSSTKFIERYKEGKEIILCNVYQQYDGYLEGVGLELIDFLKSKELVNGIPYEKQDSCFNGMGCLTAQYIKKYKGSSRGLYLVHLDNCQEYNYEIILDYIKNEDVGEICIRYLQNEYTIEEFENFILNSREC